MHQLICEETNDQPAEYSWHCDSCGTDLYYEESRQVQDEDYCIPCFKIEYPEQWAAEQKEKEIDNG